MRQPISPIFPLPPMQYQHLILPAAFALLIAATSALADTYTGRVVGVTDGDTLTVLDHDYIQHKVRLSGIDAPEKSQPFGQVSRQHLASLVFGKTVTVDAYKEDRYGRTIGKVLLDGMDANLAQVRAGLAWHYKQYEREQEAEDRRTYASTESEARDERRGLWKDPHAMAPWEFRRARREQ
ncbi:thermonuclease family protein [Aromatoleum toluclasticum]|uniref:thermonuclease family protein n=1 Tax=Aromatoleum toluclasticum TaxID=92003 RepID=UPI001E4B3DAA|nr:thermonuclease family protein [Aromatoleum toluclasticum]